MSENKIPMSLECKRQLKLWKRRSTRKKTSNYRSQRLDVGLGEGLNNFIKLKYRNICEKIVLTDYITNTFEPSHIKLGDKLMIWPTFVIQGLPSTWTNNQPGRVLFAGSSAVHGSSPSSNLKINSGLGMHCPVNRKEYRTWKHFANKVLWRKINPGFYDLGNKNTNVDLSLESSE